MTSFVLDTGHSSFLKEDSTSMLKRVETVIFLQNIDTQSLETVRRQNTAHVIMAEWSRAGCSDFQKILAKYCLMLYDL